MQCELLGLEEQVSKAALISPEGDLSDAPADIPGSPNSATGVLRCVKAVGTYFREPEACQEAIAERLNKKLAPLDIVNQIQDCEGVAAASWPPPSSGTT